MLRIVPKKKLANKVLILLAINKQWQLSYVLFIHRVGSEGRCAKN